ncbi:hypothetical protein [Occultella gossypii]|uniref:Secreted protein n=1 Tax=Occultella gossypii TaxID=2800820 RepID=A0ABS7SIA7_9MICO|nr:hypothetical protein [Occultella gossypii]MBZ2199678.1 hypothetical protein [Occultella gossypii]
MVSRRARRIGIGSALSALALLFGALPAQASGGSGESEAAAQEDALGLEVVQVEDLPDGGGWASEIPEDAEFVSQAELLGDDSSAPLSDASEGAAVGIQPMGQGSPITAGECTYRQANDNPHESGGDASVHGWWRYVSGTCPADANVDIYLQALWRNPNGTLAWLTVDSNSMQLKPGTGERGRRVNARIPCATQVSTTFRGLTDVDLPGIIDPPGMQESPDVTLSCSPPGPHS